MAKLDRFEIVPFERVGPVSFAMTDSQVKDCLGQPARELPSRHGGVSQDHFEHSIFIDFDERNRLVYVTLYPEVAATLEGVELLQTTVAKLRSVLELRGVPHKWDDDSLLLPAAGVSIQTDEDEIKNVSVFSLEYWREALRG
jgi:hypothetical protein